MISTQTVAMWLSNEEYYYNAMMKLAAISKDKFDLASRAQTFVVHEVLNSAAYTPIVMDLLVSSLDSVSWTVIADDFWELSKEVA